MSIRYGSDGFRGIIGADFTREVLARIVLGVADWLREKHPDYSGPIPIGYDTRFMSELFAGHALELLSAEGLAPVLATRPCPSPYLAFATRQLDAPIGIQITASHNPPIYSGVKLKGGHGGSLLPVQVAEVEACVAAVDAARASRLAFRTVLMDCPHFNVEAAYEAAVLEAAGVGGRLPLHLAVDYMHGTGAGIYADILERHYKVEASLRTSPDPLFGGSKPEPLAEYLAGLSRQVILEGEGSIGIAFDGDGDRLAVIDENGRWLQTHEIFCILLARLAAQRSGPGGTVVRTVSFSRLVDRVAADLGLSTVEVPVGYKNVSEAMLAHGALIGGEESGGTGFGHYLPERDALLMALILLTAVEEAQQPLSEMVAALYAKYGEQFYVHRNVRLAPESEPAALKASVAALAQRSELAGHSVESVSTLDGVKLVTPAGWVLCRPSGTEPLLRVYAEAASEAEANALADGLLAEVGL